MNGWFKGTYIKTSLFQKLFYGPSSLSIQPIHIEGSKLYCWGWLGGLVFLRTTFLLELLSQSSGDFLLVFCWVVGESVNNFLTGGFPLGEVL